MLLADFATVLTPLRHCLLSTKVTMGLLQWSATITQITQQRVSTSRKAPSLEEGGHKRSKLARLKISLILLVLRVCDPPPQD